MVRRLRGRGGSISSVIIVVIVAVAVLVPLWFVIREALLTSATDESAGLTLKNFQTVFTTGKYLEVFRNTAVLGLSSTAIALVIGILLALAIERTDMRGRTILSSLLLLPILVSSLLLSIGWISLAGQRSGFIEANLSWLPDWTGFFTNIETPVGLVLVNASAFVPFVFLMVSAALQNVDSSFEEAARTLGRGPLRSIWDVTLPAVRPAVGAAAVVALVLSVEQFAVPMVFSTAFNFPVIATQMYESVEVSAFPPGEAAALGTPLILLAMLAVYLQLRVSGNSRKYATVGGKANGGAKIALGRLRGLVTTLVWLYVAISSLAPIGALVLRSFQKFSSGTIKLEDLSLQQWVFSAQVWVAFRNSVVLSVLTATLCVVIGVLIAYGQRRAGRRSEAIVSILALIPFAIPALLLAIGLIWTYGTLTPFIYGTLLALVIAYVLKLFGLSLNTLSSSFKQIDVSLEEASASVGSSRARTLIRIVLPLALPGIVAGWGLAFCLSMTELTIPILLSSVSNQPLSVLIFSAYEQGTAVAPYAVAVLQLVAVLATLGLVFGVSRRLRRTLTRQ